MRDDIRCAWRALGSSRTFSAVALALIAVGIGATTAILSVVDTRVIGLALCVLGAAGLLASAVPARRAARIDPLIAMRQE